MSRQRKNSAVPAMAERHLNITKTAFGKGARIVSHDPGSIPEQGILAGKKTPALIQALDYQRQGFSVIPIHAKEKKPLIAWEPYQTKRASEETLTQWFSSWPDANIAIVTGAVSGIVVVDCDDKAAARELKKMIPDLTPIPRSKTGHGWHFFFKHPGENIVNRVNVLPKMDIRGDGGYVVAPPSIHPEGHVYQLFAWHTSANGQINYAASNT